MLGRIVWPTPCRISMKECSIHCENSDKIKPFLQFCSKRAAGQKRHEANLTGTVWKQENGERQNPSYVIISYVITKQSSNRSNPTWLAGQDNLSSTAGVPRTGSPLTAEVLQLSVSCFQHSKLVWNQIFCDSAWGHSLLLMADRYSFSLTTFSPRFELSSSRMIMSS